MSLWRERAPELQRYLDKGYSYASIATILGTSRKNVRNRISELAAEGLIIRPSTPAKPPEETLPAYKETYEINKDGSHLSDKLIAMTEEQKKDPRFVMEAHGFDPDKWTLEQARHNIWNTNDKVHGIQTLYASKITVKPKTQGWTLQELVDAIKREVTPIYVDKPRTRIQDKRMLEIAYYDMHWGNASFEDYRISLRDTRMVINSKQWERIVFVVGSDLFHVDNFKSTTVNGTQLETTNLPEAWAQCQMFYYPLIKDALKQADGVEIIYIPGNHDSSVGWTFVQNLKTKFPQAKVDDRVKERKVYVYGANFLGLAHGDKSRKDLIRIFPAEFPLEWSRTKNREAHIGHLHREDEVRGRDEFGLTIRTLSTRNPIDKYHDDNGYVTAHRRFMLFEYDRHTLRHIHYV